ncbi:MAG: hypothetical protein REI11_21025, partial [Patulibacter sp.]|nr:hypothetical protein [Patulibacter sp.]
DPHHLIFVADTDGALLWLEGRPATLSSVNEAGVVVGGSYAERHRGTSAIGTSLAEGRPLQIFAGEHFEVGFHTLGCSAAPVRDPLSGEIVGAVGVSGAFTATHPHSLSVVALAARSIEHELLAAAQTDVARFLNMTEATFSVLGRQRGHVRIGPRHVELSRRHTEMLLLLCLCPEGLSAEQMAVELYGAAGRPGTVRTEMHRLRHSLERLIGERPYRLLGRVDCDVLDFERRLEASDVREVLDRSLGPTLSATTVPRLVDLRDAIDGRIRDAVLASGDVALIERWLRTPAGRDDAEASRRLMGHLGRDDPRRAAERSRLRRLMVSDVGDGGP